MREIQRSKGSGQIAYLFRAVSELNHREVSGFIEQWYYRCDDWQGIKVDDTERLVYAEIVGRGQGLTLGKIGFYGIVAQDKFYDEESFLVNGTILVVSKRRENFGRKESDLPIIKVSEQMVSILDETSERVLETARLLKLPLEEVVLANS
jgi:hypothetical protein